MKKIRLSEEDFAMFDDEISPSSYEYFLKHKDAFKRMWMDQGRKFWSRFLFCFKSFTLNHGAMKDFPAKPEHYEGIVEELFQYIHAEFVKGKFSQAKNLVMDVVVVAQSRHLIQHLESRSFAKDPFYHKDTREVYRRLFGPPGEKESLLKVYFFLSLYLKFGGSVVECLRQWVEADLCASDDDSAWRGPNMDSPDLSSSSLNTKPKRPDPVSVLAENFDVNEDGEKMYSNEMNLGSMFEPKCIKEWVYGDPRLFDDPKNPLLDKRCDKNKDWREGMTLFTYMKFLVFVADYEKKKQMDDIDGQIAESFFRMMAGAKEKENGKAADASKGKGGKGNADVKTKSANATVKKDTQVNAADPGLPKSAPPSGKFGACCAKECLRKDSGKGPSQANPGPIIVNGRTDECCSAKNCLLAKKSAAPKIVTGRTDECCSAKNCLYRKKSDAGKASEKTVIATEVQTGSTKKDVSTQCEQESMEPPVVKKKQKKKSVGESGRSPLNQNAQSCCHKVGPGGDKSGDKGGKQTEYKCTCPKTKKQSPKSEKKDDKSQWELDYKKALEDIWKFKTVKSKGRGSNGPNAEVSIEEEILMFELLEKAKSEKYALDKSMRNLLPDNLIPDGFKIVHAEFLQSNSKKIEKRVKLIAVCQGGADGRDLKQLTYTISFPKLKLGSKPTQPEVRVDGGAISITGLGGEGHDSDDDSDEEEDVPINKAAATKASAKEEKGLKSTTLKKDLATRPKEPMAKASPKFTDMVQVHPNCRMCASCLKPEPMPKTYKKCQKCKDENVKKPRYYCGRECQTVDWRERHKMEHRNGELEYR